MTSYYLTHKNSENSPKITYLLNALTYIQHISEGYDPDPQTLFFKMDNKVKPAHGAKKPKMKFKRSHTYFFPYKISAHKLFVVCKTFCSYLPIV